MASIAESTALHSESVKQRASIRVPGMIQNSIVAQNEACGH
jgi:hypothetical protein